MSVTQKQVSERLNISRSLVTRALRGDSQIAEATRLLIENTAKEMGYSADLNREARMMNAKRHGYAVRNDVVAVLFCPAPGISFRTLPYSEPILEGMEAEAATLGMDVCFCPSRSDELPRLVRDRSVDGVIVFGYFPEYITAIRDLGLPVVTFQSRYDDAHNILSDDRHGMYQATRHLLELGHRSIAFLGVHYVDGQSGGRRLQGYLEAMDEYGVTVPDSWICTRYAGPYSTIHQPGCECAACLGWETLLDENHRASDAQHCPFTAVVCYNDAIAMAVVEQAQTQGLQVPRDLSVTGFDDISLAYRFPIALTSVAYARGEMGRQAMRLLHRAVHEDTQDAESEPQYHRLVTPTSLSVRHSTAVVPSHLPPLSLAELVSSHHPNDALRSNWT